MRDDEEFFRQVAMREIVCACGEDCLDFKGAWLAKPKERIKQKTGNPLVSKHLTMAGLHECTAAYVMRLHQSWMSNATTVIKLRHSFGDLDTIIRLSSSGAKKVQRAMEVAVEKLKFYRYSQPMELREAAFRSFGDLWKLVSEKVS